jgi:hypothetical protein|tara:strand:- start:111 stop:401 length:291 start_codon:yes stop_codon:yes gene_type:complete
MAPTITLKQAIDRTVKLGRFYSFEVFKFKSKRLDFSVDLMLINFKNSKLAQGWLVEVRGFNPLSNSNYHLSTYIPEDTTDTTKSVDWAVSNLPNTF